MLRHFDPPVLVANESVEWYGTAPTPISNDSEVRAKMATAVSSRPLSSSAHLPASDFV